MNVINIAGKNIIAAEKLSWEVVGQQGKVGGIMLSIRGKAVCAPQCVPPIDEEVTIETPCAGWVHRIRGARLIGMNLGEADVPVTSENGTLVFRGDVRRVAKIELLFGGGTYECVPQAALIT